NHRDAASHRRLGEEIVVAAVADCGTSKDELRSSIIGLADHANKFFRPLSNNNNPMKVTSLLLTAALSLAVVSAYAQAAKSSSAPGASASPSAPLTTVDIGGGRKIYLKCQGTGSPTVVLVGGLRASADDWSVVDKSAPAVFPGVAKFTRVCAYDRPGTPC